MARLSLATPSPVDALPLRIQIDKQDAEPLLGQGGPKVDRGCGFANPALLICHRNYLWAGTAGSGQTRLMSPRLRTTAAPSVMLVYSSL